METSVSRLRRPKKTKKSPVPALFFAKDKGLRDGMINDYKDFVDERMLASERMLQAVRGKYHPLGGTEEGHQFNPEVEFPRGSFPRPWPFVGGRLLPAPPTPPTRELIYKGKTIVWRGEIPTIHVPSREPEDQEGMNVATCDPIQNQEVESAG